MSDMSDLHKYDSIISLPHHQSVSRRHMSMSERAAQFAPFATLTGHNEAIAETQRLTDEWIPPTEEEARELNMQTVSLQRSIAGGDRPFLKITHFCPDDRKSGGSYVCTSGSLRRIDEIAGVFILTDGTQIEMRYITSLQEV